ncbi:hypothetical protein NL676_000016 [Syzygium grande]|nr:hypothetical protein NL676_000016 [Syzygium grande]
MTFVWRAPVADILIVQLKCLSADDRPVARCGLASSSPSTMSDAAGSRWTTARQTGMSCLLGFHGDSADGDEMGVGRLSFPLTPRVTCRLLGTADSKRCFDAVALIREDWNQLDSADCLRSSLG